MLNLTEYGVIEFLLLIDCFCFVTLFRDEGFLCMFNSVNISCLNYESGIVWVLRIVFVRLIIEIIIKID